MEGIVTLLMICIPVIPQQPGKKKMRKAPPFLSFPPNVMPAGVFILSVFLHSFPNGNFSVDCMAWAVYDYRTGKIRVYYET